MTKEELKQRIHQADCTLLENFDNFYDGIKERLDNCSDIEIIPGSMKKIDGNVVKKPGFIKFI